VAIDLEDGGVDHGVFHVGIVGDASNSRFQISAFTQSRKRMNVLFQWPKAAGRSRRGLPVRDPQYHLHKPSVVLTLRPGSPGLPRQCGSIFAIGRQSKRIGPSQA
jgi:hypothetical protein